VSQDSGFHPASADPTNSARYAVDPCRTREDGSPQEPCAFREATHAKLVRYRPGKTCRLNTYLPMPDSRGDISAKLPGFAVASGAKSRESLTSSTCRLTSACAIW